VEVNAVIGQLFGYVSACRQELHDSVPLDG
jgi:hypothetical protein